MGMDVYVIAVTSYINSQVVSMRVEDDAFTRRSDAKEKLRSIKASMDLLIPGESGDDYKKFYISRDNQLLEHGNMLICNITRYSTSGEPYKTSTIYHVGKTHVHYHYELSRKEATSKRNSINEIIGGTDNE